jgi:inward rectifier potassium channel
VVFAIGACAWLVSALLEPPWCYALWAVGCGAVLFSPLSRASRTLNERHPIDQEHLSERYGLLTIIVLGESFVKVLSLLAAGEGGVELAYLLKGFFNLLITCGVWWIYFDDVAGARLKNPRGGWIVWLYGHLPLAIGITAVAVAVKKAVKFDLASVPDARADWLLAGSLALTFLSVAMLDSVTERKQSDLSDRHRVNLRVASGALLLVLGQVGTTMTSGVFLGVIALVCLAQVLFDMAMAPFEEHDEGFEATSWADSLRRRLAGDEERPARRAFGQVVRKGAPPELRRDLYFFFIEGSWTRLLVALMFAYLMINVMFAGLYLIEPDSIGLGSSRSFSKAFAFSVQTLSTIGYGGISPQTTYGDMLVTVEAAVGLLGVALATGLMFAKVSRPHSSVLFSRNLVVTTMHDKPVLMFRAGNARGNEVVDASISVSALCDEITPEGHHIRRVRDLKLARDRSPVFMLSWVVMHELDAASPLADVDWTRPEKSLVSVIVTMLGHDATYGQTTHARHMYYPEDVRVGERFVDVLSELPDGRMMIDYTRFHDTEPDDTAREAAKARGDGGAALSPSPPPDATTRP